MQHVPQHANGFPLIRRQLRDVQLAWALVLRAVQGVEIMWSLSRTSFRHKRLQFLGLKTLEFSVVWGKSLYIKLVINKAIVDMVIVNWGNTNFVWQPLIILVGMRFGISLMQAVLNQTGL